MEETALSLLSSYLLKFNGGEYDIAEIKKNEYHYESAISKGKQKVKLQVYFGKKGNKTVIQGDKESDLYKQVSGIVRINEPKLSFEQERFIEPEFYIGTDESGKGDYFGPLVIAGVIVNKDSASKLKAAGVRDSKLLSDRQIDETAPVIKKIVGDDFNIIVISPSTYNSLWEKMGNVNNILGWAHAKVIENLLQKKDVPEAICDKFAAEMVILKNLQEKGSRIRLHQYIRAERFAGVAAASILARNSFNRWFDQQKTKSNLILPKGASSIVDTKVKEIKLNSGSDFLKEIAKLHFKTTNK